MEDLYTEEEILSAIAEEGFFWGYYDYFPTDFKIEDLGLVWDYVTAYECGHSRIIFTIWDEKSHTKCDCGNIIPKEYSYCSEECYENSFEE